MFVPAGMQQHPGGLVHRQELAVMQTTTHDKPRTTFLPGLPQIGEMVSVNGRGIGRVFGYRRIGDNKAPWEVKVEVADGIHACGVWCNTTRTVFLPPPAGATLH